MGGRARGLLAASLAAAALTVVPVGAAAPPCTVPDTEPDTWQTVASVDATYDTDYARHTLAGKPRYALVVDPFLPCRFFRIGTPEKAFADRGVVQRSVDGGRTWRTVLAGRGGLSATRLYVPAPGVVLVAESGGGTGVLRSDDAGDTWRPANGGLATPYVDSLGYAPGDATHLYAVVLTCATRPDGCRNPNLNTGEDYVGEVELWHSHDGGTSWRRSSIPDAGQARSVFAIGVAPGSPREPFVYDAVNLGVVHAQQGRVLRTSDGGATFTSAGAAAPALRHHFTVAAGPRDKPRLVLYDLASGRDQLSGDGGASWSDGGKFWKTERAPTVGLADGRLLTFGVVGFGGSREGNEPRAFFSRDGFRTVEVSRSVAPGVPRDYAYVIESSQPAANGDVYVTFGVLLRGTTYRWRTVRYAVPSRGATVAPPADPKAKPPAVAATAVTRAGDGCEAPGSGVGVAFDGAALLVGDGADVVRVDPETCAELGRTRVEFPGVTGPRLDTVAYDATADALYAGLATGRADQGDPVTVWRVPLAGAVATPAFTTRRCLPHRDAGAGVEILAWDRETATLATCHQARATTVTPTGTPDVDANPCYLLAPFRGHGYGWSLTSWTALDDGRALLLADTGVGTGAVLVDYDLASCGEPAAYGADAIGAAKAADHPDAEGRPSPGGRTQLACDPVTFGRPVLWQRAGGRLTPYDLPGDGACSVPTAMSLRADACAVLTVAGGRSPLAGQPVRIDGRTARTGADGVACAGTPAAGRTVAASFAGAGPYLASRGARTFAAIPVPRRPDAPPPVARQAVPPAPVAPAAEPAIPVPPAPAAPAVPPPPPVPGVNAPVGAPGREEQQQHQLALVDATVSSEPEDAEAEEQLAMVLVVTGAAAATAWCVRARAGAAAAPLRAPARAPSPPRGQTPYRPGPRRPGGGRRRAPWR